jgi:DeoR/GlpR family transcriptional regulator of sugar metabolism
MLKEERQRQILEKLNRDQQISLVSLSQVMAVSYDSIRRDIIELEDKGLLKKVHGGAVANSYLSYKAAQGLGVSNQEVLQITRKVQKLLENKRIVLMDGGTTNFHIAEQLPKNVEMTVITNSLPLAMMLNDHPKIETILLGGSYYKRYQITMGSETIKQLEFFKPDLYLMGFNGLQVDSGLTIRHYEESLLKRAMMAISKQVAVCAIPEKLNIIENYKVCDLSNIDVLITSLKPTDSSLDSLRIKSLEIM